jgi:hypothetical protein
VLKKSGFYSATKKKVPMLKKTHRQKRLEFSHYHENRTSKGFYGQIRQRLIELGDGKVYV